MNPLTSHFVRFVSWQTFLTRIITIGSMALGPAVLSPAQTVFQPLGFLDGSGPSEAAAISADGSKIVGYSAAMLTSNQACWWTTAGIALLPGMQNWYSNAAVAVSADGNVITGYRSFGGTEEAFYWTPAGQIQLVPLLSSPRSATAWGVNAAGTVVVGAVQLADTTERRAFRWDRSQANAVYLPHYPSPVPAAGAFSVSDDGRRVVGWVQTSLSSQTSAYWDDGGAPQPLYRAGDTVVGVSASGISGDGSVIVGSGVNTATSASVAFKWTAVGGMVALPNPTTGAYAIVGAAATRVSGNGRVIIGYGENARGEDEALVWVDQQPYRVSDIAAAAGVLPQLWEPLRAYGVDYTGNSICGYGKATSGAIEAYLLVIDATPAPPVVAPAVTATYNKTNGALTIRYPSVTGLTYRVRGGAGLQALAPIGNWTQGTGAEQTFIAGSAITGGAGKYFLQVEVKAGP